jgi:aryl-alcohol dehydrogenase-like predicted oxidoreductase
VVSKANQYAKDHGKTPFCIYQGNWSVLDRSFERDIIPMARSEGLALAPWGVLAAGKIRTNAEEARRKESGEKGRMIHTSDWERTPEQKKVCDVLEEIGKELGTKSITSSKWNHLLHPLVRAGTDGHE